MQFLVLSLVASSLALAQGLAVYSSYPLVYTAQGSAVVTPTQQQYQTQDVLGQYAYGYAEPHSSKQEFRSIDGITRGSYSYRDAAGKLQTVDYRADDQGFHVAATNLPQQFRAVGSSGADIPAATAAAAANNRADAVEVAAATTRHLAAHEAARLHLAQAQQSGGAQSVGHSGVGLPLPVADTAEVAAAKSIHLKRVASEALRNELISGRSVPSTSSHVILPVHSIYSIPRYYSSGFYY
ncbi:PREDICTED: adult-specific rigid cuticular protein 15.7 [Drosophila arizonae]|uniref:Adult-specific rigid cuticular protein 15.7 n=1 Tax=Drosophila arizonae TaxID=7263 RepID=A0ABM1P609_DROAR|nr:PREDICTED: adult-specific rigid cuticular protein 15.7 [Drosophila arizonae]